MRARTRSAFRPGVVPLRAALRSGCQKSIVGTGTQSGNPPSQMIAKVWCYNMSSTLEPIRKAGVTLKRPSRAMSCLHVESKDHTTFSVPWVGLCGCARRARHVTKRASAWRGVRGCSPLTRHDISKYNGNFSRLEMARISKASAWQRLRKREEIDAKELVRMPEYRGTVNPPLRSNSLSVDWT